MNLSDILVYSLLAAVSALSGTYAVLHFETWSRKNSVFIISFATGVMLTIAFVDLIPEAFGLYGGTPLVVFAGFIMLYILQNIIMFHPCHDEHCATHLRVLPTVGMTLHSFLDGVIISVGFEANLRLGILLTLAILLHKIPDGITITGILLHSKMERSRIILISVVIALLTPIGALASYFFLESIAQQYLGVLLALTAGSFIYLAAADLLPEMHHEHHRANPVFFFTGILVVALFGRLIH